MYGSVPCTVTTTRQILDTLHNRQAVGRGHARDTLEVAGPDDLVVAFGGGDPADQTALLEQLRWVERPGTEIRVACQDRPPS